MKFSCEIRASHGSMLFPAERMTAEEFGHIVEWLPKWRAYPDGELTIYNESGVVTVLNADVQSVTITAVA